MGHCQKLRYNRAGDPLRERLAGRGRACAECHAADSDSGLKGGKRMENQIYDQISSRTGGDIYIGVVGLVRTGKSTFIKRFMETSGAAGYGESLQAGARTMNCRNPAPDGQL